MIWDAHGDVNNEYDSLGFDAPQVVDTCNLHHQCRYIQETVVSKKHLYY